MTITSMELHPQQVEKAEIFKIENDEFGNGKFALSLRLEVGKDGPAAVDHAANPEENDMVMWYVFSEGSWMRVDKESEVKLSEIYVGRKPH